MNRFANDLLIAAGAVVLAVAVLAGVGILLSHSKRQQRQRGLAQASEPEDLAGNPVAAVPKAPERKFSIKRTKSEVGFVYWVLEGYGPYTCFVLCDTWDEAVQQAKLKVAEAEQLASDVPAGA